MSACVCVCVRECARVRAGVCEMGRSLVDSYHQILFEVADTCKRPFLEDAPVLGVPLPFAGNSGCITWVRHSSRKSSATHSCNVYGIFVYPNNGMAASVWGFSTCAQMHAIAYVDITNTVKTFALES